MSAAKRHRPHGRRIRCPGGYQAYVPEPLPPPIAWSGELGAALSRADLSIGRLAGEAVFSKARGTDMPVNYTGASEGTPKVWFRRDIGGST